MDWRGISRDCVQRRGASRGEEELLTGSPPPHGAPQRQQRERVTQENKWRAKQARNRRKDGRMGENTNTERLGDIQLYNKGF